MRHLPVYILIDTSTSMRGESIEAVKVGIMFLIESLNQDPRALETVCLSIITYNAIAEQIVPLTEVYKFHLPEIIAKGRSALDEALMLLTAKVPEEVYKTTPIAKGDWKSLLLVLSGGGYSGPIVKPIAAFKKRPFGVVIACAAGKKSHINVLKKLTNDVIQISSIDSTSIKSYFRWISSSKSTTSMKIENAGEYDMIIDALSPLPNEIKVLRSKND